MGDGACGGGAVRYQSKTFISFSSFPAHRFKSDRPLLVCNDRLSLLYRPFSSSEAMHSAVSYC
jgi:hypothetical protein